ncbi:HD domain-containing protein [Nonomuraea sp. NPDC048892]
MGLTATAGAVWAKHHQETGGWLPLWRHMADSAAVACCGTVGCPSR